MKKIGNKHFAARMILLSIMALFVAAAFSSAAFAAATVQPQAKPAAPAAVQAGAAKPAFNETVASFLVTPEWLKANVGNVVLIDARPASLYNGQTGHIPNAVNAEWTSFASLKGAAGSPGWGAILPAGEMAKRLGALGINGTKPVIIYGEAGDWGQSAWIIWILRMGGFNNAKMLDGGFSGWRAAGGKTSNTPHKAKAVTFATFKQYQPGYMVDTKQLVDLYTKPEVKLVDVRTIKEYTGEIRPFQEKRGGHLPGAINIPMEKAFGPNFRILPEPELKTMIEGYGLTDPNQEIVLYDTSGVRSSFMTMIFRIAGYKNARNYNPAFHEWAGNPDLPINTGENP